MSDALFWHRLQFGFTVTYHYLFPAADDGAGVPHPDFQAEGVPDRERPPRGGARASGSASSAVKFAVGVVTGIPLEFQFGTNWSRFCQFAGGVIGQTLAMEGHVRLLPRVDLSRPLSLRREAVRAAAPSASAVALWAGSWLSGYFIIATNAFMQHPVGHSVAADGRLELADFWAFLLNPWAIWQYLHTMTAAVVTGVLRGRRRSGRSGRSSASTPSTPRSRSAPGSIVGLVASCLIVFPTGDHHGKLVARAAAGRRSRRWRACSRRSAGRRARDHRAAERAGAEAREPDGRSGRCSASSSTGSFGSRVTGLDRVPARPVAGQHRAPLLLVPRDGRGSGRCSSLSWLSRRSSCGDGRLEQTRAAALGADARHALPVHRHHRRLVDRGARTATLARLRAACAPPRAPRRGSRRGTRSSP